MTDSIKGRRSGANHYAPRGVSAGAITYVDGDGREVWLPYPAGAALGEYLLVTGDDEHPVWMLASDFVTATSDPEPVIEDDGTGTFVFVTEGGVLVYEDPI